MVNHTLSLVNISKVRSHNALSHSSPLSSFPSSSFALFASNPAVRFVKQSSSPVWSKSRPICQQFCYILCVKMWLLMSTKLYFHYNLIKQVTEISWYGEFCSISDKAVKWKATSKNCEDAKWRFRQCTRQRGIFPTAHDKDKGHLLTLHSAHSHVQVLSHFDL